MGFLERNRARMSVQYSSYFSLGAGVPREAVAGAEEGDGVSYSGPYDPY